MEEPEEGVRERMDEEEVGGRPAERREVGTRRLPE